MRPVTESAADAPQQEARLWFGVVFIAIVVLANLFALGAAWQSPIDALAANGGIALMFQSPCISIGGDLP